MSITHWKRAAGLGFLSWLLPFVFSVLVFPLKQANAPLFDTVMAVAVVAAAGALSRWYFRDLAAGVGEAAGDSGPPGNTNLRIGVFGARSDSAVAWIGWECATLNALESQNMYCQHAKTSYTDEDIDVSNR